MEKNLKIIVIIGVIIILVFVFLIADLMLENKNTQQPVSNDITSETTYNKDDYVISQSINLYADPDAKIGDDNRLLVILESIDVENDEVTGLNVVDRSDNSYNLLISEMNLINLDYNGVNEVSLVYKTGGSARAIVGSYIYLYKNQDDGWSLDERAQHGGEIAKATGTVVDFEFADMSNQNGHIYLTYVILNDANGQRIEFPLNTVSIQSIVSSGEMTVYYVSEDESDATYNVGVNDDFSLNVLLHDGSVITFAKGNQLNVQKSSLKGYWELEKTIDSTRYNAIITDIIFGYDTNNITGIDYLVLTLEDGRQENMTLMHTQAL